MTEIPPLPDDAVRWSREPDGGPVVVLLHGYGADENDLLALVPHLPEEFAYVSLRAPLPLPWPSPGHAWYPIDDLTHRDPASITRAAERVIEWLAAHGLDEVGLLGFSQGAAVSLQTLRLDPARVRFVLALSGYAAPGDLPSDAALAERKTPVFWGRGSLDQVIPEPLIAHTSQWLPSQVALTGRIYPGLGHGISNEELVDIVGFLRERVG